MGMGTYRDAAGHFIHFRNVSTDFKTENFSIRHEIKEERSSDTSLCVEIQVMVQI